MSKDSKPSVAPQGTKTRAASGYHSIDGKRVRSHDDNTASQGNVGKGANISNMNNINK